MAQIDTQATEFPRYKLTEKCYLNDVYYEPPGIEEEQSEENPRGKKPIVISWTDKPAYFMQPVNDAAREMVRKFPPPIFKDPIQQLNIVGVDKPQTAPLTSDEFMAGMSLMGEMLAKVIGAQQVKR